MSGIVLLRTRSDCLLSALYVEWSWTFVEILRCGELRERSADRRLGRKMLRDARTAAMTGLAAA